MLPTAGSFPYIGTRTSKSLCNCSGWSHRVYRSSCSYKLNWFRRSQPEPTTSSIRDDVVPSFPDECLPDDVPARNRPSPLTPLPDGAPPRWRGSSQAPLAGGAARPWRTFLVVSLADGVPPYYCPSPLASLPTGCRSCSRKSRPARIPAVAHPCPRPSLPARLPVGAPSRRLCPLTSAPPRWHFPPTSAPPRWRFSPALLPRWHFPLVRFAASGVPCWWASSPRCTPFGWRPVPRVPVATGAPLRWCTSPRAPLPAGAHSRWPACPMALLPDGGPPHHRAARPHCRSAASICWCRHQRIAADTPAAPLATWRWQPECVNEEILYIQQAE